MYHMMQKRQDYGAVLDENEEDEEELHVFLEEYDLQKQYVAFCATCLFHNLKFVSATVRGVSISQMSPRAYYSRLPLPYYHPDLLLQSRLKKLMFRSPRLLKRVP